MPAQPLRGSAAGGNVAARVAIVAGIIVSGVAIVVCVWCLSTNGTTPGFRPRPLHASRAADDSARFSAVLPL
ncbi:hypothetical protein BMW24_020340 [Mycobacterium heckeshornense]|nr:hypothetical protein ACT16_07485 [Mycobacterium heckeshornense]PIJ31868.1 hypothetical protein BMW24_020340 [Mycobacterium heckeshornense]